MTVKAGEDIREGVTEFVLSHNWEDVYITGAIGSVTGMRYTTPIRDVLPLKTASVPVEGAAEVLSFTGEIMKRERMDPALEQVYPDRTCPLFVHIHVSCAYKGGQVKGGGLAGGKAFRSLRIFMIPLKNA